MNNCIRIWEIKTLFIHFIHQIHIDFEEWFYTILETNVSCFFVNLYKLEMKVVDFMKYFLKSFEHAVNVSRSFE